MVIFSTSGNLTLGSRYRFYSDLLDTLADSVCSVVQRAWLLVGG